MSTAMSCSHAPADLAATASPIRTAAPWTTSGADPSWQLLATPLCHALSRPRTIDTQHCDSHRVGEQPQQVARQLGTGLRLANTPAFPRQTAPLVRFLAP